MVSYCHPQGILRDHVYPRLAKLANTALWLHAVEEAVSFERSLAPLRGLSMPMTSPELMESTAEPWNQGSCLELLATQLVSLSWFSCSIACKTSKDIITIKIMPCTDSFSLSGYVSINQFFNACQGWVKQSQQGSQTSQITAT
jgi:hypothetical protein